MSTLNPVADQTAAPAYAAAAGDLSAGPDYLNALLAHGLLISTDVAGLYGRSARFEDVVERVNLMIGAWGAGRDVEVLRFPPAMSRQLLEQSGYLRGFPDQVGTVFGFCGDDRAHRRLLQCLDRQDPSNDDDDERWTDSLTPTQVVMTPVACYPVYPVIARRGPLPPQGHTVDIFSYCFRHEPSLDPERMQLFRQREYVHMGRPEAVLAFREQWLDYALEMMGRLELPATIGVANDPFFGRAGKIVAEFQRNQQLKFELLIASLNPDKPIACGSFNYHTDRFGSLWNIVTDDGVVAHTGCCGFGLERLALSLFKQHGFDTAAWPPRVRAALWGE